MVNYVCIVFGLEMVEKVECVIGLSGIFKVVWLLMGGFVRLEY